MISIEDFPKIDEKTMENIKTQSCGAKVCVNGIPYDFNGNLSLESKVILLYHLYKEIQKEIENGAAADVKAGNAISITNGNTINVNTTDIAEPNNNLPITSKGVYQIVGTLEIVLSEV